MGTTVAHHVPRNNTPLFDEIPEIQDTFLYGGSKIIVTRETYNKPISPSNCVVIGVANPDLCPYGKGQEPIRFSLFQNLLQLFAILPQAY